MLEEFWIEYQSNSIKRYEKEFPGSVDALDRLMTKDQIAVATVFRCIQPSELKSMFYLLLHTLRLQDPDLIPIQRASLIQRKGSGYWWL